MKKSKNVRVIPHPHNRSSHPGRTIIPYSEYLRRGELAGKRQNYRTGEYVVRQYEHGTADERRAAREWLWHVENGRIGGPR